MRTNVSIEADALERALSALLDDGPQSPILFHPAVDRRRGLTGSIPGLMDLPVADTGRPDGLLTNDLAFASFNDAVLRMIVLGVQHDRFERLADRNLLP